MSKCLIGEQLGLGRPATTQEVKDEFEAKCEPKNNYDLSAIKNEIEIIENHGDSNISMEDIGVCLC